MISFECRLPRRDFVLDAAFEADRGVTALFGVSGSGKTTALRLIAGLERPERGRIAVDGSVMLDTGRGVFVPASRRRMGMVFQDAQLFPHLSVRQNLEYGRWFTPPMERRIAFEPVVEVLGIAHLLERRPATLSGGERQRVAIGRALLTSPRVLLMDEPLASLDAGRKLEVLPFIERMRDEFAIPILYVSHAIEEVARLASRVVRLEAGRVVAVGPPGPVLSVASLSRTAERFDAVSILRARVKAYEPGYGITVLDHPAGEIVVPGRIEPGSAPMRIAIRATNVTISIGRPGNISVRTSLAGQVVKLETDEGPFALATIELTGGDRLQAFVTRLACDELGLGEGDDVLALVKAVAIDERSVAGLKVIGETGT